MELESKLADDLTVLDVVSDAVEDDLTGEVEVDNAVLNIPVAKVVGSDTGEGIDGGTVVHESPVTVGVLLDSGTGRNGDVGGSGGLGSSSGGFSSCSGT